MNFSHLIIIFFIFALTACGTNDQPAEEVEEQPVQEETFQEEYETDSINTQIDETEGINDSARDNYNTDRSDSNESPPKIKSVIIETVSNNFKDGLRAVITTDEPEDRDVEFIYQWKHNGTDIIGATEQTLQWNEEFKKGDTIALEIIPYDDLSQGIWKSEGSFTIPNSPPLIESTPRGSVKDGAFVYKVEATDLDDDALTYSIENAPEGMTIDPDTGEISWKYSTRDRGDYKINIIVSDNDGGQTFQELAVTVN